MSTSQVPAKQGQSARDAKRRKRKERDAATRTPEPKDIVSGAGQPLDLSVRRELEEQLGHDFSQVRLHTDRDSGTLADMLGADAFAVGKDIFFREGTYRPGTTDGQRLLAHELLHTVQNPDGLGALRAGRELGAVSVPQQPIEREAESAAADSVRESSAGETQADPSSRQIEDGQSTPGWLRYATVDADQHRMEQLDPATLVDRLANGVLRSLRGDPEDKSKRTRRQLGRLPDELQDAVLERLESRLLSSEHERVLDLVEGVEESDEDLEQGSLDAPGIERDPVEELLAEQETERKKAAERTAGEQKPAVAPGPEKNRPGQDGAAGSTPENGGASRDGGTPRGGGRQQAPGANAGRGSGSSSTGGQRGPQTQQPAAQGSAPEQQPSSSAEGKSGGEKSGEEKSAGAQQGGGEKKPADSQEGKEDSRQQGAPAASKEESAAKNRPGAVDPLVAGQQIKPQDARGPDQPAGSPTLSGKDARLPGAASTLEGVRNQDLDGAEQQADEDPFGSGSESEVDVGGGEKSAWDTKIQPEDFLPEQDLDVSGVPTADTLEPGSSASAALPSFPAPPVTKADKVQAERDAEDAEEAAADAEPESEDGELDSSDGTESSGEADDNGHSDDRLSTDDLKQTAEPLPSPGTASRDPKSGDDPKAGPVAAQTTVQEAPGKPEGGTKPGEQAAKEEKGTAAGGEKPGSAQEKTSPQPVAGKAAEAQPSAKEGQKQADTAQGAGKSQPTADSQAPSPARDTHITGGSNADTPGGASSEAAGGAESQGAQSEPSGGTPAKSDSPPAKTTAAPHPTTAPAAPAAAEAPAPEEAPAHKAAEPKSAPSAKSPHGAGGGGTGGGGGGKPAAAAKGKKDSGPAPNLSGVSPEAGLSQASKLQPHKALEAMSGVQGSVGRTVGDEHKQLASAPPSMQRPAGAPQTLQGKPKSDAPAGYSQDPAEKSKAPEQEKAEVKGAKPPEGEIEAEKAEEPSGWDTFKMALGFGLGKVVNFFGGDVDASELAAKFAGLPTKDDALKKAQAGNAPGVQMKDAAEQTAGEQGEAVDSKGQEAVTTGRDDAGRAMGEDQVYPDAPKEHLAAKVPGRQGGNGGQGGGGADAAKTGAVPPEAASKVAEHERKPQFQAAFSKGNKGISDGRQAKDKDFRTSQQKHKQKVDAEIAGNTKSQTGERTKAKGGVTDHRDDWRKEQDGELKTLGTKKTERHEKIRKDVKEKEEKTDKDVGKEKDDGDKKIQDKNDKAEKDAEKQRDDSVKDSGNWVSKAFDWIKQKVIEIKNAIVKVIKEARDAVVGVIKHFKETVEGWINDARKAIVDAIKNLVNDLIDFAKAMVRAVIELAGRIRKLITALIDAAIALVNKLATMLKRIINDLLDAIGKLLSGLLDILKKALDAVVQAVKDAIKAVLDFASKLLSALGDWMLIAVDFLSDPGGWLSGAKNSAVDGAKHHLFAEVSSAVKQWFKDKIQEIIGVPKEVITKLINGGFTLDKIVKEAWDAVVPQLPLIIGELVMTKVVAKLIPGAGWALAVIDAIRTAWGALSAILRALTAVLDWLKAVRSGGAGLLFAKAVASGVVALLEVLYQALMNGIGKYVAKVGKRLKGVAAKLGKGKPDKKPGTKSSSDDDAPSRPAAKRPTDREEAPSRPRGQDPAKRKPRTEDEKAPAKPKDGEKQDSDASTRPGKPKPAKGDDAKADTRPTPSAKSKPEPKPRPKPDPEPASKPKDKPKSKSDETSPSGPGDKDDAPSKPKPPDKDQDPNRPKEQNKDADPTKPKSQADDGKRPTRKDDKGDEKSGRPKGKESDPKRPRNKDDDPKKPKRKHDKDDGKRPKHGKDDDGRKPKDRNPAKQRQDKKNRRKKDEESKDSKDARLAKIVARLHPRIDMLVGHGIDGRALDAVLQGARLWYRLTELSRQSSQAFDVVAELNPVRVAGKGFKLTGTDLRPIIHKVSADIVKDPRVMESAEKMQLAKNVDSAKPIDINEGEDFPAVVRYLRSRGEGLDVSLGGSTGKIPAPKPDPGVMEAYRVGRGEDRAEVLEEAKTGRNAFTQIKPDTYPKIARKLTKLEKSGLSGAGVAAAMQEFSTSGRFPASFTSEQKELMRDLHWLMHVRESVRSFGNLGFAAMTTTLISRGDATWNEAFRKYEGKGDYKKNRTAPGGRGLFPMSMAGAPAAARQVEDGVQGRPDKNGNPSDAEQVRASLIQREIEVAERWLQSQMKGEDVIRKSKKDVEAAGENIVRDYLLKYYGL